MRSLFSAFLCLIVISLFSGSVQALPQSPYDLDRVSQWDEKVDGPLPHLGLPDRTGPVPGQSLKPYAVKIGDRMPPTSGVMEALPEYSPSEGILLRYSSYAWPTVVTDIVAAVTSDPARNDKAFVVLENAVEEGKAIAKFQAAGADLNKVVFFQMPTQSIWLRDYGPNFVLQDGTRTIVDSHYYMYLANRFMDDFVPTQLAEDCFEVPLYHMGMVTSSGGNFLPGPNRSAFVSDMCSQYNPGFSTAYMEELYSKYIGIDTLHIFPEVPPYVDLTGHIDMWMYLIDDDTVMISEFEPGSDPTAMQITENAVVYMQNLGFTVHRLPDHNGPHPSWPGVDAHYTYTNTARINDIILIPSYGDDDPAQLQNDGDALAAYQAAAPNCMIIQIPCYDIIWAAGAIHCISGNVPLRMEEEPAAHLVSPDGGELLVSGTDHKLIWGATDNESITGVDLYYSADGGLTYPHLIASGLDNDSEETWTVPYSAAPSDQIMVKVVAQDGLGNSNEDVSETVLEIRDAAQKVYDFSVNADVDRWALGSMTTFWSQLDGVRFPNNVSTKLDVIDRNAYDRLAYSDAVGGDYDPLRYISEAPDTGSESTHIFTFTLDEDPSLILDMGILWEGYGDNCGHMEVYVWDETGGNWSDGAGTLGQNMYMANFAGNRDEAMEGHIRSNFDRYIDNHGKVTILIYGDQIKQKSFHDYIALTVTSDQYLKAGTDALSAAVGGVVDFTLMAGSAQANRDYFMLGSVTGTSPGLPLPGGMVTLPLNWDGFTDAVISLANSAALQGFHGQLDGNGDAAATLDTMGALPPAAVGTVMNFAYLLYYPAVYYPYDFVSNTVTLEITP